jgi:excisionase family DNA binding protein
MPASTTPARTNPPAPSAQVGVMPLAVPLAVPPREAGHMLSLSLSEVYERLRNGELASYVDGRARRVIVASIHAYMTRRLADSANGWRQITPQPPRRRGHRASRERG